jgi:hypothetical protein
LQANLKRRREKAKLTKLQSESKDESKFCRSTKKYPYLLIWSG